MKQSKTLPKPSSAVFYKFVKEVARPLLLKSHTGSHAAKLSALLLYFEQTRYDFSAERAFQTRPISNAEVAAEFGISIDTAKRWIRQLEAVGLVNRQYRRNRHHAFKNLLNRIGFSAFAQWFKAHLAAAKSAVCTPNKKTIYDSKINMDKNGDKTDGSAFRPFPASGGIKYCPYWEPLTDKALAHFTTNRRPSPTILAESFRRAMKEYNRSLSAPAIIKAWTNWCKNAFPA